MRGSIGEHPPRQRVGPRSALGRFLPADKARFYAMARDRATKCGATLDLICSRGLSAPSACRRGRGLLVRIIQMLTKLNARLARYSS